MKNICLVLAVVCSVISVTAFGQGKTVAIPENYIPWLDAGHQSDINVIFNALGPTRTPRERPNLVCPPQYVNLLSNTNLFTDEEQKWTVGIASKYQGVTTNSGPSGSIGLTALGKTNGGWLVSRFRDTNSGAMEEVFFSPPRYEGVEARSRTESGDGYDVVLGKRRGETGNGVLELWRIRNNVRDGLYVGGIQGDRISSYRHYVQGKTVGLWFIWDGTGKIALEAEFKSPYDFDKYVVRMPRF